MADEKNIALEGDYFIVVAAAYYFVQTYIPSADFDSLIPQTEQVCEPITEAPNNYVFLIGDGMGVGQTKLFERYDIEDCLQSNDGEEQFYGYYLPYSGKVRTDSLPGTTDSAAGATALATGVSTTNRFVGRDAEGNDLVSLTELANSLGMATAVMSTDKATGATPAGFSAHANDRDDSAGIIVSQKLIKDAGTKIVCGLDNDRHLNETITEVLDQLDQSEKGFFIMYEEGHIDKHSHDNDLYNTFGAVVRFNQAIGIFIEYAFYHPDTMLWITADHETGGLKVPPYGTFNYTRDSHSSDDVPIFAYGQGAERFELFHDRNTAIPKYIASLWGVEDFGA